MSLLLASLALAATSSSALAHPKLPEQVFLIAGQSNSANHGWPPTQPTDRRVLNWNPETRAWRWAADPQLGATGTGGSPWPTFGSRLARDLDAPVGLVTVGVGGTAAHEWLPDTGALYARLHDAVKSFPPGTIRAVLWHQGEADAMGGTAAQDYARMIGEIIARLNADAGYAIPWFVASVSYVDFKQTGPEERRKMEQVHRGQELLWEAGTALRGANTDDLTGPEWRHDGIHFNERGLAVHGNRWVDAVEPVLYPWLAHRRGD